MNIEEIQFKILRYALNNIKQGRSLPISNILKDIGLENLIEDADDFVQEIKRKNFVEIVSVKGVGHCISRVTIHGKKFIEEYYNNAPDQDSNLDILKSVIEVSEHLKEINDQLKTAKKYLMNNSDSDYRNAIKESVGAVESCIRIILKDNSVTLGDGLKKLSKINEIHPAFTTGISKLYGFNSDAGGIRHGLSSEIISQIILMQNL